MEPTQINQNKSVSFEFEDDDYDDEKQIGWHGVDFHGMDCRCDACTTLLTAGMNQQDVDASTDKHDTFLQIENSYFEAWADKADLPNQALIKFFRCIQLCKNYNRAYASKQHLKDTNHELKLLKYHYNSLKYCVHIQYLLKKYNRDNSYSLLIYGFVRNIIETDFNDAKYDDIVIPLSLINLCVTFYNELITNYTNFVQLAFQIENTSHFTHESIKYITINYSNKLVAFDTIEFALSFMEYHHNKNQNEDELEQILWNTVITLQYNKCLLWYKYACYLYKVYLKSKKYKECQSMIETMENHLQSQSVQSVNIKNIQKTQPNIEDHRANCLRNMKICNDARLTLETISEYYAYKIQSILQKQKNIYASDAVYEADNALKCKLMSLFNHSSDICKVSTVEGLNTTTNEHIATYELIYAYAKVFLLLNDHPNSFKYLHYLVVYCYPSWSAQIELAGNDGWMSRYDGYTSQKIIEFHVLLYILWHCTGAANNDESFIELQTFVEETEKKMCKKLIDSSHSPSLKLILKLCQKYNVFCTQAKEEIVFDEIIQFMDKMFVENEIDLIEDSFLLKRSLKQIRNKIKQDFIISMQ